MSALSIQPTYPIFTDIDGQPLDSGYIWIGTVNLNPITNPINVYWDAALTQPAAQPIRTVSGYPSNAGTPARLYVGADYSIQVQNKNATVVYSAPQATERLSSDLVTFIQDGSGAVERTAQNKMREIVSVKDFGAVGNGTTNDTASFQAAIAYLATKNGGTLYLPIGSYVVNNLVISNKNIILQGDTSGYGYENPNSSVKLISGSGATWCVWLKYDSSVDATGYVLYSGLKNLQVTGNAEYGVLISTGATLMENVTVTGFEYGCSLIALGNANRFENCSFSYNSKVGFAVTEGNPATFSYLHPNLPAFEFAQTTTFSMTGCTIRQNQFGIILRQASGVTFDNCIVESNTQAGLYFYVPDTSGADHVSFVRCWFENNYDGYTSGSTSYSLAGINYLKTSASTFAAFTSATDAGFQVITDAQTRVIKGFPAYVLFDWDYINATGDQKGFNFLCCSYVTFNNCQLVGGDQANYFKMDGNFAGYVHFINANGGIGSITGGNLGNRSALYEFGTAGQIGCLQPLNQNSGFGGPIYFDPLRTGNVNTRVLDDYVEGTKDASFRTTNYSPFSVTQTNTFTKIGRIVTVQYKGTLTVDSPTVGNEAFYLLTDLPYNAAASGYLVGQCRIVPTGGGATVLNDGLSPMYSNQPNSIIAALDNFPALSGGETFDFQMSATYITAT